MCIPMVHGFEPMPLSRAGNYRTTSMLQNQISAEIIEPADLQPPFEYNIFTSFVLCTYFLLNLNKFEIFRVCNYSVGNYSLY